MDLNGQKAAVTGSSRGIGRAIALRLARAGCNVAIVYRQDARAAREAADECAACGVRAVSLMVDVTQPEEVERLASMVESELGPIDILVNNVGEFYFAALRDMTPTEWRTVVDSNLTSVFLVTRAFLAGMEHRGYGRIVNIGLSPMWTVRAASSVGAYAVAKVGVSILTRTLAVEEAPFGITVNCVSPGLIDNGYLPPEQYEWMRVRVPMGRLGEPMDVAEAVLFLVSSHASYVSGADLAVSGGWDWQSRPNDHDTLVHELFADR